MTTLGVNEFETRNRQNELFIKVLPSLKVIIPLENVRGSNFLNWTRCRLSNEEDEMIIISRYIFIRSKSNGLFLLSFFSATHIKTPDNISLEIGVIIGITKVVYRLLKDEDLEII